MIKNLFKKKESIKKIDIHEADVALRLMFEIAISDGKLDSAELTLIKKRASNVIDENVGTGKARRASMGNIQPRTVGAVSNDELDAEYKKKKATDKAKDVETANKVDVSGLSPSEALMRKKAAVAHCINYVEIGA